MIGKIAVLLVSLAGCYPFRKTAEDVSGMGARVIVADHPVGAAVDAVAGEGGFAVTAELTGQRVERSSDRDAHSALGAGVGLRLSPIALLADDHRLERYLDAGVQVGVHGSAVLAPPHGVALRGATYYGGWVELGLVRGKGGYFALTGELRVVDASEPWLDRPVEIAVGLAWRERTRPSPHAWHD